MKKIAVYFPGVGYHCDKPLLYYGRDIAYDCGYEECINVTYTFDDKDIAGNEKMMTLVFEQLYPKAEQILEKIDWSSYDDILFVGKSVGTVISAAYAKNHHLHTKNVYFTPVEQIFQFSPQGGIAFLGTKDPFGGIEQMVKRFEEANIPLTLIEGANHSLEVDDCMQNIEILSKVMQLTAEFLKETE